jgi:hypothetical protein
MRKYLSKLRSYISSSKRYSTAGLRKAIDPLGHLPEQEFSALETNESSSSIRDRLGAHARRKGDLNMPPGPHV